MVGPPPFEELVADALDSLPQWVLDRLENVEMIVEDRPPGTSRTCSAAITGCRSTERAQNYSGGRCRTRSPVPADDRARVGRRR